MGRLLSLLLGLAVLTGCGEGFMPGAHRKPYRGMEEYQARLEAKLLRQHRNHPVHGKKVYRVELEVTKDIQIDVEGRQHKVEWAQLIYDHWGNRIPELEKEFFVVTFGSPRDGAGPNGRIHNVKPSISVGMNAAGLSGEHRPVTALPVVGATQGRYCPSCGQAGGGAGICAPCLARRKPKASEVAVAGAVSTPPPSRRAQQGVTTAAMARRHLRPAPAAPLPMAGAELVPPSGSALNPHLARPVPAQPRRSTGFGKGPL
ncbi:MAG: hypothetical protein ACYTGH_17170, partial [Planctomycetota bacterium]